MNLLSSNVINLRSVECGMNIFLTAWARPPMQSYSELGNHHNAAKDHL